MDESGHLILQLFLAFAGAALLGKLARKLGIPALLGEVLAGVFLGTSFLHWLEPGPFLETLSILGAVILLFTSGLEVSGKQLRKVGKAAVATAVLGVILPFLLILSASLLLKVSTPVALFFAAAGVATSVGVTAQLLRDRKLNGSPIAAVILGAAVLDDILGISVIAIIASYSETGVFRAAQLGLIAAQVVGFGILAVLLLPRLLAAHAARANLNARGTFTLALAVMLGLSALSTYFGMAAIIGAFFAGVIFAESRGQEQILRMTQPLYQFLTPFFFVMIGVQLNLSTFNNPRTWVLALAVTLLAIIGKVLGGYLANYKQGARYALGVGFAMVPRGEVGLVIAGLGLTLGVIGDEGAAIITFMAFITTLITPLILPRILRGAQ
ncbi:MAG TPA: cation:proton antiporter [Verrucomicrobiae bacterium]|nr:cation:proton antiporter [Verrucomicrobiae bacterium]